MTQLPTCKCGAYCAWIYCDCETSCPRHAETTSPEPSAAMKTGTLNSILALPAPEPERPYRELAIRVLGELRYVQELAQTACRERQETRLMAGIVNEISVFISNHLLPDK